MELVIELMKLLIKLVDNFFPVFTLIVGAVISFIGTLYLSNQAYKRKLKEETEKRKNQFIIHPIINFVETLLKYMSQAHWANESNTLGEEDVKRELFEKLKKLQENDSRIMALLMVLSDDGLETEFIELTRELAKFRLSLEDKQNGNDARKISYKHSLHYKKEIEKRAQNIYQKIINRSQLQ